MVWNKKKRQNFFHLTRVTVGGGGEAKMESGQTFLRFFWNPSLTKEYVLFKGISYFYINSKRKTTLPLPAIYNMCYAKPNDPSFFA